MTYRQNTDVFLRNATNNESTRAILQYACLNENNMAGSDGYRLHVDWQPDDSIESYLTVPYGGYSGFNHSTNTVILVRGKLSAVQEHEKNGIRFADVFAMLPEYTDGYIDRNDFYSMLFKHENQEISVIALRQLIDNFVSDRVPFGVLQDVHSGNVGTIDIQEHGFAGSGKYPDYMSVINAINFDTPTWQGEVYGADLKQALDTAKTFCRPVDTRSYDDSIVTLRIVPASARNEPAEIYVSSKNEEGDVETGMDAKQLSRIGNENEPLEIKLNWRYLNQARIGLDQYSQDSKIKITYNGAKKALALGERGKRLVVIMPLSE